MTENKHRKVAKAHLFRSQLTRLGACSEALEWVGHKSLHTAWRTCKRGDWMLWLAGRVEVDLHILVLAACQCARLALVHVKPGEERPRVAIETAEAWCRGTAGVTLDDVRAAAESAAAAATAASAAAATYNAAAAYTAACAAAYAATCAYNAAVAAANASAAAFNAACAAAANAAASTAACAAATAANAENAAYNAACATAYGYNAAARAAMLRVCAELVHQHISAEMISAKVDEIDD